MKIGKYILSALFATVLSAGLTSCFQDLNQDPPLNYPAQPPAPAYNPLKLFMPFDGNANNGSVYDNFIVTVPAGSITYPAGTTNQSYLGGDNMYITATAANVPGVIMLADTLNNLKAFTVSVWMNLPTAKKDGAQMLFQVTHKTTTRGNLDIYTDGNGAKLMCHVYTTSSGARKDGWMDIAGNFNMFDQWVHVAVRYNSTNSTFDYFRNGVKIDSRTSAGLGVLNFETPGPMLVGNWGQNTNPAISTVTTKETWAAPFRGQLDQLRFYNAALTDAQILDLFTTKK